MTTRIKGLKELQRKSPKTSKEKIIHPALTYSTAHGKNSRMPEEDGNWEAKDLGRDFSSQCWEDCNLRPVKVPRALY